jgi:VWFA-related protein
MVHSDLVLVPVTVTTGNGRVVPGLSKEDFTVLEDRVPQTITHFTCEDAPATIGLVFDASDSMQPRIQKARESAYAILEHANPGDEFFLIRFSTHPTLVTPLTTDAGRIRSAVDNMEVGGSTALLDAVKMAWDEMGRARHSRKAILVISDGEDNSSRTDLSEFERLVTENDTTIYALYIGLAGDPYALGRSGRSYGAGLLEEIAKQTGGRMFPVSNVKQLPDIALKIGSWVRSQYVLGYVPQDNSPLGVYHKLQVKIAKPAGFPRLHSTWRLGYYAPNR